MSQPTPLLAAARELYASIDARAAKAGDEPVPAETVEALRQSGLFGVMAPSSRSSMRSTSSRKSPAQTDPRAGA